MEIFRGDGHSAAQLSSVWHFVGMPQCRALDSSLHRFKYCNVNDFCIYVGDPNYIHFWEGKSSGN